MSNATAITIRKNFVMWKLELFRIPESIKRIGSVGEHG
jgi:hypothetical protein